MELPFGCRDLDFITFVADFGVATRFVGTTNEVENAASRLLQRSVFAARLCLKFSAQSLRALFSRASIRTGDTGFPEWFREQLIGLGMTIVGGTIFLVVLYAVLRLAPRTWWIWGTVVAVIFSFILLFLTPVFIEPFFNTYKPVTKPEISEPILAMARANQDSSETGVRGGRFASDNPCKRECLGNSRYDTYRAE